MLLLQAMVQQELTSLMWLLERLTSALAAASSQIPSHVNALADGAWCLVQHVMHEGLPKASMHAVSMLLPKEAISVLSILVYLQKMSI